MSRNLHSLLINPPPLEQCICEDPHQTWADLLSLVAGTSAGLPAQEGERWLLSLKSPFHFAAAMLACWQKGAVPVILPDHLPGTLAQAAPFGSGAFCDQPPDKLAIPVISCQSGTLEAISWQKRHPQDIALELFTSGSTGERKRICKTFAQLEAEISVLDDLWGNDPGLRLATVSHQHIYGLIFRILWPLANDGVFSNTTHLFWETLLAKLITDDTCMLVSSPANLKHLVAATGRSEIDWSTVRIFSSGGPLPRSVALEIANHCGEAPCEVLGSTETGGIAWRQQRPDSDQPWTPLPRVSIRIEGNGLAVRSPFLANPTQYQKTGDRAAISGNQHFFLKGRLDRIVKLAEKRVSLTEMERHLTTHLAVTAAKLLVLPTRTDQQRDALGCVIQLSIAGRAQLFRQGRAALVQTLRQHLKPYFEAVTLPRHWRFPNTMPVDSQSKITTTSLLNIFEDEHHERPRFPILHHRETTDKGVRFRLEVPENLLFLEGHFQQIPVVAGLVQLHWVLEIIAMETGQPIKVAGLEVIKFHQLLFPKDHFEMEIQFHTSSGKWHYRLMANKRKFASGRIIPTS